MRLLRQYWPLIFHRKQGVLLNMFWRIPCTIFALSKQNWKFPSKRLVHQSKLEHTDHDSVLWVPVEAFRSETQSWLLAEIWWICTFLADCVVACGLRYSSQASPYIPVRLFSIGKLPFGLNLFSTLSARLQGYGSQLAIFHRLYLLIVLSGSEVPNLMKCLDQGSSRSLVD